MTSTDQTTGPDVTIDVSATHPAGSPAIAAEPGRIIRAPRWGIATDVATKATEALPDDQREALRWLQRYGASSNLSRTEVAERLTKPGGGTYSADSIYQALTGRRAQQGANLQPLCDAIASLRRRLRETHAEPTDGFVETPITRAIFRLCRAAFTRHHIGFVFGPSQIGKSVAITEYAHRHNHGETQLVRMPTGGSRSAFIAELAERLGLPGRKRDDDTRRRIFDSFDEHTLLIVDEAHQGLMSPTGAGMLTLEFIRELHDRRRCGVVIVATEVLLGALQTNKILNQLWRRRKPGAVLNLPTSISEEVLEQFSELRGLPACPDRTVRVQYEDLTGQKTFAANPSEIRRQVVNEGGLGSWCKLLEDAEDLAKASGGRVSWGRVLVAYCQARAMEGVL